MTDRERWTVYPLLFLALGVALRGNFAPTHNIRCHRLAIFGPDGTPQMELTAAPTSIGGGGQLKVLSDDGKVGVVIRAVPQGGVIETMGIQSVVRTVGDNGIPQAVLASTPNGGFIQTRGPNGMSQVALASTPNGGVIQTLGQNGAPQVLLESTPNGGVLAAWSPDRTRLVVLGPPPNGPALTIFDADGHPLEIGGMVWQRAARVVTNSPNPGEEKPADEKQPESGAAPSTPADGDEPKPAEPKVRAPADEPAAASDDQPAPQSKQEKPAAPKE